MHTLTFYPLGNADSYFIELEKGKKLLFDFANRKDPEDHSDKRIDLASELRNTLENLDRDFLDVVAFTHLDDDHIHGATDFFFLEWADKYQSEDRIKIRELWVPAAVILEEGLDDEARILRQEARHRLIEGRGIRVFSRPEALTGWLEENGLTLESRRHLITNAGQLVSGFDKNKDGIEFFVHSPFSKHCDEGEIDRNNACLGFQATFDTGTQLLMTADATHEVWHDIVTISKAHGNESRLMWDILKVPHHCSYLSLGPDKGEIKTVPTEDVKWLLEQGKEGAHLVITSDPVPFGDEKMPPHRQAYNCYEDYRAKHRGKMYITMEWPTKAKPEPLVINIDSVGGATAAKRIAAPAVMVTGQTVRSGQKC
jgi:hypothetical protein